MDGLGLSLDCSGNSMTEGEIFRKFGISDEFPGHFEIPDISWSH
jgi:hypothetical protein